MYQKLVKYTNLLDLHITCGYEIVLMFYIQRQTKLAEFFAKSTNALIF